MWAEHERRSKELDEAKRVRQEREVVAISLALEKRAQNLEKVKEMKDSLKSKWMAIYKRMKDQKKEEQEQKEK